MIHVIGVVMSSMTIPATLATWNMHENRHEGVLLQKSEEE